MVLGRKIKNNKKAFYFTLDALFASLILVGGLVLISQHLVNEPSRESLEFLSPDILSSLSELKINELNSSFVTYLDTSPNTKHNNSVLEQIGVYWATNELEYAQNLSRHVLEGIFPNNTGINLEIEGDILFEKNISALNNLMTGERMITGIMEGAPLTGTTSSAYLTTIEEKRTSSFAYFGGFVGQGGITVRLDDLPSDISSANVREMFIEGDYDSDFNLLVNGAFCRFIDISGVEIQRINVTNCSVLLQAGDNTVELNFTEGLTNASVSGGLLGVKYNTAEYGVGESEGEKRVYMPDINGVINLFDGFMVPGTLQTMDIYLHYWVAANVTLPIYFDIGNTTVLSINTTGEQTATLTDAYLDALLDYVFMSNTTTPFRLGFYEGSNVNTSGNLSDVFLLTSRHNSMGTNDIVVNATDNFTRIKQVRDVDNLFVDIALNASGNRVGLVSFGTGASVDLDSTLSIDITALHTAINGYVEHPADAQRYLCGAMETAKTQLLTDSDASRNRAIVLMTDGDLKKTTGNTATCAFGQTDVRSSIWRDAVHQACNFTDFTHGNPYNITFYTIAFGPEAANDPAIIGNLTLMANCTGGRFALGTNASELTDIYREFAEEISASSIIYTFQRATSATEVESRLYGDSYIDLTYDPSTPAMQQNQIPITTQTNQFGTCTPTVNIPQGISVTDAHIVSYSGDYWTKRLMVDGGVVYNLSSYMVNYSSLGDPFQVLVPPNLLTTGDHTFDIVLGANDSNDVSCSVNDSLIYTGLIDAVTNRTIVLSESDGCEWIVESEDNDFNNISIPSDYTGSNNCNYTNTSIIYNINDAYDVAVVQLLMQLDIDRDGRVSVNFDEDDLEILILVVSDVPYLWGPTLVKIKVWQ